MDDIIQHITTDVINEMDELLIKALERKGYSFDLKCDLEMFIKQRCNASKIDNCTTYYVDGIPFFEMTTNTDLNIDMSDIKNFKIECIIGHYRYL